MFGCFGGSDNPRTRISFRPSKIRATVRQSLIRGVDTTLLETEMIAPAHPSHKWVLAETVEPSCTKGGYKRYTCECGEEKIDERTDPLGHDPETRGAIDATDETTGYTGDVYCRVCGELIRKGSEIPALSHPNVILINVREATCTEKGYSGDWYCTDCEKIVGTGSETPLAEHSYAAGKVVPPTCTEEGYTLYVCELCGDEKRADFLARLEHQYEAAEVVEPTCTKAGYTLYRCTLCGDEYRSDATAKLGHVMGADGTCQRCGVDLLDRSGDFGASFPAVFLQNSDRLTLTDDRKIREYAESQQLTLRDHADGKFIALYRSHDIFLSILEVNTVMTHPSWSKPYAVQYYVYDIYVRNIENLFTAYTTSDRMPAAELIANTEHSMDVGVVASINGDYMGNTKHCLVCERNGNVLRLPERIESDACILYYDGTMETVSPSDYNRDRIAAKSPYQIWNFGPALVNAQGKAIEKFNSSSYDGNIIDASHPRASIGYYAPGHYNFIVVDGRSDDSHGVRMSQLAGLHEQFGSAVAYNMDGGDSAQAYFGDMIVRIDEDRTEQRKLFDLICIGEVS